MKLTSQIIILILAILTPMASAYPDFGTGYGAAGVSYNEVAAVSRE